jgi:pyrrolysine biosynthesis protein PylC
VRLAIVGGKLQGVEAAYLAAKAGYETVLVDRREAPPAAGLADRHVVMDVTADEGRSRAVLGACDAVLPACEDDATLAWLVAHVPAWDVPLLFDPESYAVTSSKLASNALFERLDVPRPRPWPEGGFPLVVKPSAASGSEGVKVVRDEKGLREARARLEEAGHEVVVEEYVAGPSLSLEVLCWDGRAVPLQVTGLEFDEGYDCERVVAPVGERAAAATPAGDEWERAVPPGLLAAFDAVTVRLAEGLGLRGLMDVEVMLHDGQPKVLEIDARLPSQTPTAVYWSSGLNIVELLQRTFREGRLPAIDRRSRGACVFQHVRAQDGRLGVRGEHVMGGARPLALVPGFFGAHEALTDYQPGSGSWSATLITLGATVGEARRAADEVVVAVVAEEKLYLQPEGESA